MAKQRRYIIGYSLDAVMNAVARSVDGDEVVFLRTADLCEPMDTFHDMVTDKFGELLGTFLPALEFDFFRNPRNLYLPYGKVKVKNDRNGIFRMPFNLNTFDPSDGKRFADAFLNKEIVAAYENKSGTPSVLLTAMKKNMPEDFATTFIRPMQLTRWRGIPLSTLTMYGYCYEFPLEHFGEDYSETFCRPRMSWAAVGKMLLDRYGIRVEAMDPSDVGKFLKSKHGTGKTTVMDNRIDQYLDYICGNFGRVKMFCRSTTCPKQLTNAPDGIYYTPLHEFWGIMVDGERYYKYETELDDGLYSRGISEIPLTRTNVKAYSEYSSMVSRYGDNTLDLGQRVSTLVR